MHGYDLMADVAPGHARDDPRSRPTHAGRFEIELENTGCPDRRARGSPLNLLAHGIGGGQVTCPFPDWLFFWGGARRPRPLVPRARSTLEAAAARPSRAPGRPLPAGARARSSARRALPRHCSALSRLDLLALVFLTALIGEPSSAQNLAPTFVYVDLLARTSCRCSCCSATSGRPLNPWLAIRERRRLAVGGGWGRIWTPPLDYPAAARRLAGARSLASASRRSSLTYPEPAQPARAGACDRALQLRDVVRDGRLRPAHVGRARQRLHRLLRACSRGSRRSASTTAGSSSGCRSPGSPAPSRRPRDARLSSRSCSARSASTGSAAPRSGRTCAPTSRGRMSLDAPRTAELLSTGLDARRAASAASSSSRSPISARSDRAKR